MLIFHKLLGFEISLNDLKFYVFSWELFLRRRIQHVNRPHLSNTVLG